MRTNPLLAITLPDILSVLVGAIAFFVGIALLLQRRTRVPINPMIREFAIDDPVLPEQFTLLVDDVTGVLQAIGFKYLTCIRSEFVRERMDTFDAIYSYPARNDIAVVTCSYHLIGVKQTGRVAGVDYTTEFADGHVLTTANTNVGLAHIREESYSIYWFVEVVDLRELWSLHEKLCEARPVPRARVAPERQLPERLLEHHRRLFEAEVAKGTWRRVNDYYTPRFLTALWMGVTQLPGVVRVRRWWALRTMRRRAVQLLGFAPTR